jgi:toxin HigB-1
MIRSFKSKMEEKLFNREYVRKLPRSIHKTALRKLLILDAAIQLNDLRVPPGNCLESLSGERKGQHSIRINKQWRICFMWRQGNAHEVEIIDYH